MKRGDLTFLLLLMAGPAHAQQDAPVFQPPVPHDVQRYEAGWNKNPFTLKTLPPVVESVSFAADLAIATYYGDSAAPTIIIVNTKTTERTSLKQGQPAPNGMQLRSVKLGSSHKDLVVEVTLGSETAAIRYNDSYLKQMATAETTKASAMQQSRPQSGTSLKIPLPQPPSQQGKGATPGTVQAASIPPDRPGFVPPSGRRNTVNPPPAPPNVSPSPGANGTPPGPAARKLVGPVLKSPVIPQ